MIFLVQSPASETITEKPCSPAWESRGAVVLGVGGRGFVVGVGGILETRVRVLLLELGAW